jgi:MoaA/NifB/PqqE/SkfB family radical SAM enzyme
MRDVTVLWALRSPCNLGCAYCYFGTIEDHRAAPPTRVGQLSHLSRTDLDPATVMRFATALADSPVRRVFLAGGEPLIWPHTLTLVQAIKDAGVEVVVCTNGIPLARPEVSDRIVALGVDGVSVSLDSVDAAYNDHYRPSRSRIHGWHDVLAGIRALLAARSGAAAPKVGVYAAITCHNIPAIEEVAALAAHVGCDYFVPQPISLAADHPLHDELSLGTEHAPLLRRALHRLYTAAPVSLPDPSYVGQFLAAAASPTPRLVRGCFGGSTLFFIEPDGSVWDCPSYLRIAATPASGRRSIRDHSPASLFGPRPAGCGDCALFSRDCVSMWPLMGFDRFLHTPVTIR